MSAIKVTAWPTLLADQAELIVSWNKAWSSMGVLAPALEGWRVTLAWAEQGRHYHNLTHLRECLALLQNWHDYCVHPADLALALWFHDAVYDTSAQAGVNELESAAWAAEILTVGGASNDVRDRVCQLVMATRHHQSDEQSAERDRAELAAFGLNCHERPDSGDLALLLDIDLAILGSPAERYWIYEHDIRREYAKVPEAVYRTERFRVLKGFLDRPRLYTTDQAHELLDAQARLNLASAMRRLR